MENIFIAIPSLVTSTPISKRERIISLDEGYFSHNNSPLRLKLKSQDAFLILDAGGRCIQWQTRRLSCQYSRN